MLETLLEYRYNIALQLSRGMVYVDDSRACMTGYTRVDSSDAGEQQCTLALTNGNMAFYWRYCDLLLAFTFDLLGYLVSLLSS